MKIIHALDAIRDRLEEIKKVLSDYKNATDAAEEAKKNEKLSAKIVNAVVSYNEETVRDEKTENDRQYGTQQKIARYAFGACLAAIIYAGISSLQLYEMRIQTAQVFHQSEVENADASFKASQWLQQLKVAQEQAKASQDSAAAIQRQMSQDQRAWINIKFGTFHWAANEPLGVPWALSNTGKTPAKHIEGQVILEKVSIGQLPHFVYGQFPTTHFDINLMVPNAPAAEFGFQSLQFKPDTKENEPLKISVADSIEIGEGRAYVAVHGVITYKDIFKTSHWIKFCTYSSGNMITIQRSLKACTDYNDTDDN